MALRRFSPKNKRRVEPKETESPALGYGCFAANWDYVQPFKGATRVVSGVTESSSLRTSVASAHLNLGALRWSGFLSSNHLGGSSSLNSHSHLFLPTAHPAPPLQTYRPPPRTSPNSLRRAPETLAIIHLPGLFPVEPHLTGGPQL